LSAGFVPNSQLHGVPSPAKYQIVVLVNGQRWTANSHTCVVPLLLIPLSVYVGCQERPVLAVFLPLSGSAMGQSLTPLLPLISEATAPAMN
jgi:hypothetical protein